MRLRAALLPPREVQEDLADLVASVKGGHEQLAPVPAHLLHVRLVNFGNLTQGDAEALRTTLRKEMAQWPPMTFHFGGGVVVEPLGDDSAWAKLDGDLDQIRDIANLTVRVVKRLGFLVDRRLPRTLMRVGRITPATTEAYLQRLLDQLEGYSGPEWTSHDLALLHVSGDSGKGASAHFEILERLKLVGDDRRGDGP